MNRDAVKRVADAVLYEGYILYPYRPAVKNRQRWTFGGLYPEACCQPGGSDASGNQTECLVRGTPGTEVSGAVRFLHLTARVVGEFVPPLASWEEGTPFRPVEVLQVGEKLHHSWQEAEEREVEFGTATLAEVLAGPRTLPFAFPGGRREEPVPGPAGAVVGVLAREQQAIEGAVEVSAVEAAAGLYRLTVRVANRTGPGGAVGNRDEALLRALVSTHTLLGVRGGEFVSLLDPPGECRAAAEGCRNVGTWPVLVGEEGRRDTVLSSPIILYDYPQVAAESPGDFFDGAEIDEMLTLRILTLTDEEKRAMAAVDARGGALLARTEALAREEMARLHGAVRDLRPAGGGAHG